MVHRERQDIRDGYSILSEPFGRSSRPTHQPVLGHKGLANTLNDLLGCHYSACSASETTGELKLTYEQSTVATVPSLFIPAGPPTPPSRAASLEAPSISPQTFTTIFTSASFWLLLVPFAVYVGLFNALSSLLNQILFPYGFSETAAGLTGAILILVGLVASAVTSPLLDRNPRWCLPALRGLVPVIAMGYLAFVWAPQTREVVAPYAISAVLGAASFSLVPLALELLVEVTWPVSPEVGSSICWAGGQLSGGLFIVIMDALAGRWKGEPSQNMKAALVFQAVIALVIAPVPLFLGFFGTGTRGREEAAKRAAVVEDEEPL